MPLHRFYTMLFQTITQFKTWLCMSVWFSFYYNKIYDATHLLELENCQSPRQRTQMAPIATVDHDVCLVFSFSAPWWRIGIGLGTTTEVFLVQAKVYKWPLSQLENARYPEHTHNLIHNITHNQTATSIQSINSNLDKTQRTILKILIQHTDRFIRPLFGDSRPSRNHNRYCKAKEFSPH